MSESKLTRDFPSNSDKSKREQISVEPQKTPELPKCNPIARGTKTKKSFLSGFLGEGAKDIGSFVINDILIPAAKSTLYEIITGGASMSLFGERRKGNNPTYRDGGRTYISYNNCSNPNANNNAPRDLSRTARARHDFDDVGFDSKLEAEEVLSALVDQIIDYDAATVANFYELSGIDSNFTDRKYGWTNLREAYVERSRNKYIIVFPQTKPLD